MMTDLPQSNADRLVMKCGNRESMVAAKRHPISDTASKVDVSDLRARNNLGRVPSVAGQIDCTVQGGSLQPHIAPSEADKA
jgi:hypothetical protein